MKGVNRKRRDHVQYRPGELVLMHRDSHMHIRKSKYEHLGPDEVSICLNYGRYEIKKVGTSVITKAAKDCGMAEILELLEAGVGGDVLV